MCKKTTPITQPCVIATQAQLDAEEILTNFIRFEDPAKFNEMLHTLFMDHLHMRRIEEDELEADNLNLYYILHKFLNELQEYDIKQRNTAKEKGAA